MKKRIILIYFLGISMITDAQVLYPDSEFLEYYRVLEMKNTQSEDRLGIFPNIVNQYRKDSIEWNIWSDYFNPQALSKKEIRLESFRFSNYYNSTYPRGYNDGAIWKGKGLTTALQGGVSGKYGLLEFTLAPLIFFSQNKSFELADQRGNNNSSNYQFTNQRIDFVQRYGDDSFTQFDWGQTDVRMVYKSFTLGVSTQNFTIGPAQQNPIIMSDNASGIPRIDIGTHKPIVTKIGSIEGKAYWGVLRESDFFDENNTNDNRYWTGMSLTYSPSFISGVSVGFNRSFIKKGEEFINQDLYKAFWWFENQNETPNQNDEYDQLASATLRWLFKEVGFEVYAEYGKNDFGGNIFSTEPEHARGYTLGFSKYIDVKKTNVLKLTYEHASLDKAKSGLYRGHNTWYTHNIVNQGYTINGQVIGAGIGPGSVTDFVEALYFFSSGMVQINAQRIRFNDDFFIQTILDKNRHDHEWTIKGRYSQFVMDYLIGLELAYSYRDNVYYITDNYKTNYFLGLSVSKQFKKT